MVPLLLAGLCEQLGCGRLCSALSRGGLSPPGARTCARTGGSSSGGWCAASVGLRHLPTVATDSCQALGCIICKFSFVISYPFFLRQKHSDFVLERLTLLVHGLHISGEGPETKAKPIYSFDPSCQVVWLRQGCMGQGAPVRTSLTQYWDLRLSYQRRNLSSSELAWGIRSLNGQPCLRTEPTHGKQSQGMDPADIV